jgi:EamA domain-containing membrane protein RarD
MPGLDVISFSEHVFVVFLFIGFQQKKNGENLQDFLSLGLLGTVCILTLYLSSVSINLLCLDIFESFDYISQVFFLFMQK